MKDQEKVERISIAETQPQPKPKNVWIYPDGSLKDMNLMTDEEIQDCVTKLQSKQRKLYNSMATLAGLEWQLEKVAKKRKLKLKSIYKTETK